MSRPSAHLRKLGLGLTLAGLAGAGLVAAQPAPPAPPQPAEPTAPYSPSAPVAPPLAPGAVPEEAPPAVAPTPAPVVTPPITEKEIAPAPAPPTDASKPAPPPRRARYDVAILQALDKVTAESLVFEAPVGKPIRYKSLIITVRACEKSSPEEPVEDSIAYLTVDSQPRAEPGLPAPPARQVFKGWMYASSPGLNPLQHPVYDAWVINCRAAAPAVAPVSR